MSLHFICPPTRNNNKKMKLLFKKILIVFLGLLGGFLILIIITAIKLSWDGYQWQKSLERWEESLRKPYKEDIYGGKTPEETWQMFLDALRKEDIDLASKYFDVEHQGKVRQVLKKIKQENKLTNWIKELEILEKDKNVLPQDRAYYSYEYYDEETQQNLWSTVVFYLNPYTKVWKILY